MNISFRPQNDVVAIRPDPRLEQRYGKIIVPETADHPEECGWIQEGTVVFAGPGDKLPDGTRAPMYSKPGDKVLFVGGRAGDWVTVAGERLYVVHEEQFVIAVLERKEPVSAAA